MQFVGHVGVVGGGEGFRREGEGDREEGKKEEGGFDFFEVVRNGKRRGVGAGRPHIIFKALT